jgi:hypothetical protein
MYYQFLLAFSFFLKHFGVLWFVGSGALASFSGCWNVKAALSSGGGEKVRS